MTFSEAKAQFDKKFGRADSFTCFLPDHLSIGKIAKLKRQTVQRTSNIINGSFCMRSFTLECTIKIILVLN